MTGYLFCDTETTGLSETDDRITQISAIRTDADLNVRGFFKMHVSLPDEVEISEYVRNLTGLTKEMLKDEPTEFEMIMAFIPFANNEPPLTFAGFNTGFDLRMIIAALNRYNIYSSLKVKTPALDVMKECKLHLPDVPRRDNGDGTFSQYKLELVGAHLGIHGNKQHDSFSDIAQTIKIARHIRRLKR